MAFLVVAEEQTDVLWELMTLKVLPAFEQAVGLETGFKRYWKTGLLVYLVDAEAYWSSQPNPLSPMISTLLYAAGLLRKRGLPCLLAARFVGKNLLFADKTETDVGDYEDFQGFLENARNRGGATGVDYDIAVLRLMHPLNPQPYALLQMCTDSDSRGQHRVLGDTQTSAGL